MMRVRHIVRSVAAPLAILPLVACLKANPPADESNDSGVDANVAPVDGAIATKPDAGADAAKPDAAVDASHADAANDATVPPEHDAGDAGGAPDATATLDAAVDATSVVPDATADAATIPDASDASAVPDANDAGDASIDGATPCFDGGTLCDGACVDLDTNVDNCGACGAVCSGGANAACVPSGCLLTLATGQGSPTAIALDSARVYWVNSSANASSVVAVSLDGGAPVTFASAATQYVASISVDPNAVYYTDSITLYAVPLDGGAASSLTSVSSLDINNNGIGSFVEPLGRILLLGSTGFTDVSDEIESVPLDGGAVSNVFPPGLLASGAPPFAANATAAYSVNSAADGNNLVGIEFTGENAISFSGSETPAGIALDSENVYWTSATGNVWSNLLDAGAAATQISRGESAPQGIAVVSNALYWTDAVPDGSVVMANLHGDAAVITLASGQGAPYGVVVSGSTLYWTNGSTGTVMRLIRH